MKQFWKNIHKNLKQKSIFFYRKIWILRRSFFGFSMWFSYREKFVWKGTSFQSGPKVYFHFMSQLDINFTSTAWLRPKLYFDLYFSTNKKSRFGKMSKYKCRSTRTEVKSSKYRKGRTDAYPMFFGTGLLLWTMKGLSFPKSRVSQYKDIPLGFPALYLICVLWAHC